ncbi:hypothetical protein AX14_009740 [Amanita brunnescens Koide BX004]|nr:hypothetical protein AX14_009740 [Amanita brunnescens Koide BX004]
MLTSSPVHSSNPHWVHLCNISDRSMTLSLPPEWGRLLRITNLSGWGSTGAVYQGSMKNKTLAVKIVKILGPDDGLKRQKLQSESERLDALIMELHGHSLSKWDDLGTSEYEQINSCTQTADKGFLLIDFTESRKHICPDDGHFDAWQQGTAH